MSGNGNGNGAGKKAWTLAKNGMLWKKVLEYASQDFVEQADAFVAQLQETVQPADALQGLLLDRIAAGYLRKQLLLEFEAAAREHLKKRTAEEYSNLNATAKRRILVAFSLPLQSAWSGNALRYEALLDQGFHRDFILLQELKKAASTPPVSPDGDGGRLLLGGGSDSVRSKPRQQQ